MKAVHQARADIKTFSCEHREKVSMKGKGSMTCMVLQEQDSRSTRRPRSLDAKFTALLNAPSRKESPSHVQYERAYCLDASDYLRSTTFPCLSIDGCVYLFESNILLLGGVLRAHY